MFHRSQQRTSIQSQSLMSSSAPGAAWAFPSCLDQQSTRGLPQDEETETECTAPKDLEQSASLTLSSFWEGCLGIAWAGRRRGSGIVAQLCTEQSTGSPQGAAWSRWKPGNCWISDPITCSVVKSIAREFQRCFPAPSGWGELELLG